MPQRRMIRANDLSGLFIYQDPKRGTVFYDYLTRKGYILTSSDVGMYTLYQMMLPLCLLAALGAVSFIGVSYSTALIVFLVLLVLSEILFRIFFFYKLPVAEKWHPYKRENFVIAMAKGFSSTRLFILLLLLLGLTITMPLYARMDEMSGFNLYAVYGVSFLTFLGAILTIAALIIRKKNNY